MDDIARGWKDENAVVQGRLTISIGELYMGYSANANDRLAIAQYDEGDIGLAFHKNHRAEDVWMGMESILTPRKAKNLAQTLQRYAELAEKY